MCRGQELGTEDVARAATHLFTRKNLYHEHEEREKDRCDAAIHHFGKKSCVVTRGRTRRRATVQRHTIFDRKTCIANMNNGRRPCTVQRHTFSREKTCIASMGKEKKTDAMQRYTISGREPCIASTERGRSTDAVQRHTIFDRKTCIANMTNGRRPCTVQRHTFSREKTRIASTEREKKTNRSHTTLHNTIRSSYKTTTHHITTISKPDNTTNRQNPIPCLKHHTPPHYTTKALPPKNRRKSFIGLSANRLS